MQQRNLADIRPYAKNAKKHPKKQVEQVAASIKEFGFNQPIVVDKNGVIIVGHGRYEAAKALNLPTVPVLEVDLTEEQANAYRLADNKLNESEWDMQLVVEELKTLSVPMLELTGFDKDLILEPDEQDDVIPENAPTVAQLGDIFQLGEHRVMCGDSTKVEDVEKLMNGVKADMVFTDPPYGMSAVSKSGVLKENYKFDILGDDSIEVAINAFAICQSMKVPTVIFWGANYYANKLPNSSCWLVWDKNNGQSDQMDCELAWTNLGGVTRKYLQASEKANRLHPTQKPVELIEWAIKRLNLNPNIILDLFGGSGSTLIAAEKTGRICYGMELDPKYVDVIVKRWEDYSNKKAIKL